MSGEPLPPMSARVSAWAVYHQFETKDDEFIFIGVTSDKQWPRFCEAFGLEKIGFTTNVWRPTTPAWRRRTGCLPDLRARVKRLDPGGGGSAL